MHISAQCVLIRQQVSEVDISLRNIEPANQRQLNGFCVAALSHSDETLLHIGDCLNYIIEQ